jgi:hypothetical protein
VQQRARCAAYAVGSNLQMTVAGHTARPALLAPGLELRTLGSRVMMQPADAIPNAPAPKEEGLP